MRNPNGYGCINKLSGKRRRPWAVQITIGWSDNGKQLKKYLSYHTTRAEAMQALADYNANPYQFETSNITFAEIYDKWSDYKFNEVGNSAIIGYKAAFKTSKPLHDMRFVEIKTAHLQNLLKKSGKAHGSLRKLKVLFNQLFEYAMKNDIVSKDYSKFVEIGKNKEKSSRKPFSNSEINLLWKHAYNIEFIDTILIMIYSGLRIGELLDIKTENVDLFNKTITGGLKTDAGKNRLVPIHNKVFDFIKVRMEENESGFLIHNAFGKQMKYSNYLREKFEPIMQQLNMKHRPHDCRHTFATLLNNAEANATSIKKLIGHSSFITTEKIYTHKDVEELRKAVELID